MTQPKKIYFLGIAGQMISAIACIAKSFGYEITGSDEGAYPPATTNLDNHGIKWTNSHSIANIGQPDLVVLANHIRRGNVELEYILEHQLPLVSFPEFITQLFPTANYRLVIAGTHGKSTTTSLLGWILTQAGLDPTVLIGATAKNFNGSFRLGSNQVLVLEGDEYTSSCLDQTPKFLYYQPTHAIITSTELDHMDIFDTTAKQAAVFAQFASSVTQLLLTCGDTITTPFTTEATVETYGLGPHTWRATDIHINPDHTSFTVHYGDELIGTFTTPLTGSHNVQNITAAIALSHHLGISTAIISQALTSFQGLGKRFDILYDQAITVIDDYAHHPTAIKTTLQAARNKYPHRRLWCIYEPHTFTRIKGLLPEFAHAFDPADKVIIADIYPAREKALVGLVHATDIVATAASHTDIRHLATPSQILDFLATNLAPNDVVMIMSVGNIDNLATKLIAHLTSQTNSAH